MEENKMEKIVISNPKEFEEKKKNILEAGVGKLHVLADFDRTLTKAFVDGKKVSSIIAILRNENYLDEEYSKKAQALFNKYNPIEIDPNLSIEEKKLKMDEWWRAHWKLLIDSKLNKKHIMKIVENDKVVFRKYALDFIDELHKKEIPLVIISASVGDFISLLLEDKKKLYSNVHVLSNSLEWDEQGNATGIIEPVVHVFNKDETVLEDFPDVYNHVKERKNVILLGDSIGDVGMIEGFEYDNLIKIGFLNDKIEENLDLYKKNFDVVVLNDGEMGFVKDLIKEIKGSS